MHPFFQIAAQNCRKRKMEQISDLEIEIGSVRSRKINLLEEREELMLKQQDWTLRLENLERQVSVDFGMVSERRVQVQVSTS